MSYFLITSALAVPFSLYILRNWFTQPQQVLISAENMKSIIILGGSYGGISTAHRILKKNPGVKITLISPNDALFWNIAGPRGIVPGGFADDKLFAPIAPGFKQYGDRFEHIIGTAESLDVATKSVTVKSTSGEKSLSYDMVILATGTRTRDDIPYKGKGTTEATLASLHDFQSRVKKATSIVVAGGGATGVETSGELGFEYGSNKQITLVHALHIL
jgi:NADH dehydrogenase FAD-containing subunit